MNDNKEVPQENIATIKEALEKGHKIIINASFVYNNGKEKIQDAIWYAKDLKDRYSVLWMYYDLMA